jgi:hypothetical protein
MLGRVRVTIPLWRTNAPRLTIALLTTSSALRTVGWLEAILLAVPKFRPGAERVSASWLCCWTMSSRNLRSTSPMARLPATQNISYATNRQTTARERIVLHGFICRGLILRDDLAETVRRLAGLRGSFVRMSSTGQNTGRSASPPCAGRVLLSSPKVAFDKSPYGKPRMKQAIILLSNLLSSDTRLLKTSWNFANCSSAVIWNKSVLRLEHIMRPSQKTLKAMVFFIYCAPSWCDWFSFLSTHGSFPQRHFSCQRLPRFVRCGCLVFCEFSDELVGTIY